MEQQLIHPKLDLRQPQRPIHEKSGQLDARLQWRM